MTAPAESSCEYAVGFTVQFSDDGPPLSCILGFTTHEQAQKAVEVIQLTSAPYTGPRPARGFTMFMVAAEGLR